MVARGAACCAPTPPPCAPASSARARAFAASTSGWSNALTPKRAHSSSVAYSHAMNSVPSEGIGGELAHDLTVAAWRREWVINDGDDAAPAFAGALRHQLLDPVGQPRHP